MPIAYWVEGGTHDLLFSEIPTLQECSHNSGSPGIMSFIVGCGFLALHQASQCPSLSLISSHSALVPLKQFSFGGGTYCCFVCLFVFF